MQSPDVKGVDFVVLHIVEMSFLGFSLFWVTNKCGEERQNPLLPLQSSYLLAFRLDRLPNGSGSHNCRSHRASSSECEAEGQFVPALVLSQVC